MSVINNVSTHLERVEKKVQNYIDMSQSLHKLVKRAGGADPVQVSRYLYRVAFKRANRGVFGKFNNDGGALPTGNSPLFSHFTSGYFTFGLSYRVTQEQLDTWENDTQALVNGLTDITSQAIEEMDVHLDIALHTDGSGALTASASASPSGTQLTFAAAGDAVGVRKLRPGMAVDVWDTLGTTKRAGGPYIISTIDPATKIVTMTASITGVAATDKLAFHNLDVYGPSGLTSYSSTWPGDALTGAAGLTGDSFVHGIPYFNDATTSNYFNGKLKSSFPELVPAFVNASSGALTYQHGLLAIDQLIDKRGTDIAKDLVAILPQSQRAQLNNISIALSTWQRGQGDKSLDVMPNNTGYEEVIPFCGIKGYLSKRQPNDRVDLIAPKNFRRVQTKDIGWLKNPSSNTYIHPVYSNPSGTVVSKNTAYEMYVVGSMDFTSLDPGAGAYIYGLSLPVGY